MMGWRESSSYSLVSQIFKDSLIDYKPFFRNKILIYLWYYLFTNLNNQSLISNKIIIKNNNLLK